MPRQPTSRSALRAFASAASTSAFLLFTAACGGDDGDGRPSVDAIVESLDGAQFAEGLSDEEVRCFAEEMHDGSLSDGVLDKLVSNVNLTASELADFHPAASDAATACGFTYLAP